MTFLGGSWYHFSPLLFWESFLQIPHLSYLPNSGWGLQDPISWGRKDGSKHLPNRAQVRVLGPSTVGTEKACGLDLDPPRTSVSAGSSLELSVLLVAASPIRSPCARIRTGPPRGGSNTYSTYSFIHSFIHPSTHSLPYPSFHRYLFEHLPSSNHSSSSEGIRRGGWRLFPHILFPQDTSSFPQAAETLERSGIGQIITHIVERTRS